MKRMMVIAAGAVVLLAGCARNEATTMVAAEPIYDKYGNFIYMPAASGDVMARSGDGSDGGAAVKPVPQPVPVPVPDPTAPPNQNQNQNQNQNTSQNQGN